MNVQSVSNLYLIYDIFVYSLFHLISFTTSYGELGEVGCTISSFICLSDGSIELQPCFFATILLLYAPPKVASVLVLFVIF